MLKRLTQAIWTGGKIGLRTKHEVQGLMEDEGYRNYVLVKLLAESHEFNYDPETNVPNVVSNFSFAMRYIQYFVKLIVHHGSSAGTSRYNHVPTPSVAFESCDLRLRAQLGEPWIPQCWERLYASRTGAHPLLGSICRP